MVKKTTITSTIHFYKETNLIDKFNNFIEKETSVTIEAEDNETTPPKSPEQLLFLAVVYQALLDATKEERHNDSEEVKRYRKEATNWFTVEYGTTATDFEEVCYLAGLEPRLTRSFAQKIFTKEIKFERKRINVLINASDKKNVL
tara:strand:+ start:580 stop:1014 length:435 start_codon:yes stop_codon:yes gene_type:complete